MMRDCDSYARDCSECNEPVCRHYTHIRNDYDDPVITDRDRYGDDYDFKNYDRRDD